MLLNKFQRCVLQKKSSLFTMKIILYVYFITITFNFYYSLYYTLNQESFENYVSKKCGTSTPLIEYHVRLFLCACELYMKPTFKVHKRRT